MNNKKEYIMGFICQSCDKRNALPIEVFNVSSDQHNVTYELTPDSNITFKCIYCHKEFVLFLESR